jgi:hypothetical protein
MRSLLASFRKTFPVRLALAASLLALTACTERSDPTAVVGATEPEAPAADPGLATLTGAATAAGVRIEVELVESSAGWFAREVEIQTAADLTSSERIESQVTAADASAGTFSLRLGGLTVGVASAARFQLPGGVEVSRAAFFEALDRELEAGANPGIEVRRTAASPPQGPSERGFLAEQIRLDPEGIEQVLDLNMDNRHLRAPGGGSGTMTFLGVELSVDPGAGSAIVERSEAQAGAVDVGGMADSVDEGASTVTLDDGTVLRVLDGTRIKVGGRRLGSLTDVAAALAEGVAVDVDADAVLETEGLYAAVKIAFKPVKTPGDDDEDDGDEDDGDGDDGDEDDGAGDDAEEAQQFGGRVVSVDLDAGTFILTNGKVLTVDEASAFDTGGDLLTLEAMAGALEAGDNVMAEGLALEDAENGVWLVLEVRAEASGEDSAFGGRVRSVDLEAGTFTLPSGKVMTVTEETLFDEEGDLTTLDAMAGAIGAGDVVTVQGMQQKDGETGQWLVLEIRVNASGEDGDFGGRVESVDLEAGTLTLKSGRVYTVTEESTFDEAGDLVSLAAMAGALSAGDVVTAEGMATKDTETGAWIATELLVETNGEDGEFGGRVDAVDLDAGTLTLKNGRVYTVGGDTTFDDDGDHTTLEGMADALGGGGKITVAGVAAQDPDTGAWMVSELSVKQNGKP